MKICVTMKRTSESMVRMLVTMLTLATCPHSGTTADQLHIHHIPSQFLHSSTLTLHRSLLLFSYKFRMRNPTETLYWNIISLWQQVLASRQCRHDMTLDTRPGWPQQFAGIIVKLGLSHRCKHCSGVWSPLPHLPRMTARATQMETAESPSSVMLSLVTWSLLHWSHGMITISLVPAHWSLFTAHCPPPLQSALQMPAATAELSWTRPYLPGQNFCLCLSIFWKSWFCSVKPLL